MRCRWLGEEIRRRDGLPGLKIVQYIVLPYFSFWVLTTAIILVTLAFEAYVW